MSVANVHARMRGECDRRDLRWTGESGSDLFPSDDAEDGGRYAGPTIERVRGHARQAAGATEIARLVHREEWREHARSFAAVLTGPGSATSLEARVRHRDGSFIEGVGIELPDEHRRDVCPLARSDVIDRQRAHECSARAVGVGGAGR